MPNETRGERPLESSGRGDRLGYQDERNGELGSDTNSQPPTSPSNRRLFYLLRREPQEKNRLRRRSIKAKSCVQNWFP